MDPRKLNLSPFLIFKNFFVFCHTCWTQITYTARMGMNTSFKVLKEGFKLTLRWKKSKFQNASTLQRFHQVTPSPLANLVTCILFRHVLQHLQDSYNDFFSCKNGKSFAGRSCFKKYGQIEIVLKAVLPPVYCSCVNHQKIWRHIHSEVVCCVEN